MVTKNTFLFFFVLYSFCCVKGFLHSSGGKVIGGENITITQAPYQLSLRHNTTYSCGASIISRQWALTAAHCFHNGENDGLYDLLSGTDHLNQGGRTHPVTKLYVHPQFNVSIGGGDYDIALIFTYEPFEFSDIRQPIPLATSEPVQGDILFTSGWGQASFDSSELSAQLQGAIVPFVDLETCQEAYSFLPDELTDRIICAGGGSKSPCFFDDGSPLVLNGTQVGIVSFGVCGSYNLPTLFTNLANADIQKWIEQVTGFSKIKELS